MSVAQSESQLFELERVEDALYRIFLQQGIPAQKRFESQTNETPYVELQLVIDRPVHQKQRNANNAFAAAQPFDSWAYTLTATVNTERTQNGSQHVTLIGKTRLALQYYRLLTTLNETVSPYHTLTSIVEVGQQDSVDNSGNLQMSQLTFRGILNIRENAWPPL